MKSNHSIFISPFFRQLEQCCPALALRTLSCFPLSWEKAWLTHSQIDRTCSGVCFKTFGGQTGPISVSDMKGIQRRKNNYVVSAEPRCDLAKCFLCELSNLVHQPIFRQNHASVMILLRLFSCPQNRTCSAEVMLRSGSARLGSFRCAPLACSTAISAETLTAQHSKAI